MHGPAGRQYCERLTSRLHGMNAELPVAGYTGAVEVR